MKTSLRISLFFNLCMLAGVFFLPATQRKNDQPSSPIAEPREARASDQAAVTPPAQVVESSRPFHWSELESTDYRVYIANLRKIGCPEQTIRDIIAADLAGVNTATKTISPQARAVISQPPSLNAAQRSVLNDLLGSSEPPIDSAAQAEPPAVSPIRSVRGNAQSKITLPLVFQNADVGGLDLNPNQINAIKNLQQKFVDAVGGMNQNPDDPAYRERWQKAQPESDGLLWWTLGSAGYQQYQIAAFARSQSPSPSGN